MSRKQTSAALDRHENETSADVGDRGLEPQYWCRSFGLELGPVSRAELEKLIEDGALNQRDKIRTSESGDWIRLKRCPEFHRNLAIGHRNLTSATTAKSKPEVLRPEPVVVSEPRPVVVAEPEPQPETGSLPDDPDVPTSSPQAVEWEIPVSENDRGLLIGTLAPNPGRPPVAPPRAIVRERAPRRKRLTDSFARLAQLETRTKAVAGGLVAGVLLLCANSWLTAAASVQSARTFCDELMVIDQQRVALRNLQSPESDWNQLEAVATDRTTAMIPYLEENADTDEPAFQHLLWASRDFLPPLLKARAADDSSLEARFQYHLACADRLLRGLPAEEVQPETQPQAAIVEMSPPTPTAPVSSVSGRVSVAAVQSAPAIEQPYRTRQPVDIGTSAASGIPVPPPYPENTPTGDRR